MTSHDANLSSSTDLRARTSSKWRRFAPDVLPMHVAEMDYEIDGGIREVLTDMIARSDLGYLGPIPEVSNGFQSFAKRHWNWEMDSKQVRIFTDVAVATVEILRALGSRGDKVAINSPVYSAFYVWIRELGMQVADAPLQLIAGKWELDLAALEREFAAGAKFYLLCSPQNPMGKIFTREELFAIAELAKKYGVIVISDEIHAPLAYEPFTPFLAVSDVAREVGICVTAASKSFNLAGLKAAIAVTASGTMSKAMQAVPNDWHYRSSILGAFAMAKAFSEGDAWLQSAVAHNKANRDLLTKLVAEKLPSVSYWVADASYLAWLDLSTLNIGDNPAARILEEQRVAFVPGVDLGADYGQYVRINFACSAESLERAINAIAAYAI